MTFSIVIHNRVKKGAYDSPDWNWPDQIWEIYAQDGRYQAYHLGKQAMILSEKS